jgi:hypothetical protein
MTMAGFCSRKAFTRFPSTGSLVLIIALGGCTGSEARQTPEDASEQVSWSLDAPAVRVGGGDGPGEALDRVYGGVLRPDGSMVIGNSGSSQLHIYSPDGRLTASAGRRGAGPGEFGSINWIGVLPGDSIIVFDLRHQRFSVWSPGGTFVRMFNSQAPPGPVRPIGVFEDGSILIVREGGYDPRAGAGVVRDSMLALRMNPTGEVASMPRSVPGVEWLIYQHPTSFRATQLPFGRTGHVAVLGSHFVHGSSESGTLAVYDGSGSQVRTVEVTAPARTPSRAEISAFLDELGDPTERSALARHYRDGAGGTAAVFTALRSDAEGNLWVRTAPDAGADSVTWLVLGPGGGQIGSVRMHTGWLPLDIRRNTLLLRESNPDGVQTVSVRRIVR